MTPAGKRNQRLRFQQRAADDRGDRLGPYELPGLFRWGRVVPRTRGEVALEQRLQGQQPLEIIVPNDNGTAELTSAWRVTWKKQVYRLQAVAPTEDGRELSILAVTANEHD